MTIDFKPSQVVLRALPLTATMGHAEAEFAAALVVRALAVKGDVWRPIEWSEILEVVKADMQGTQDPLTMKRTPIEPIGSLMMNPFFRPDIYDTVDRGFARWIGAEGYTIELTEKGIEALRKWVAPPNRSIESGGMFPPSTKVYSGQDMVGKPSDMAGGDARLLKGNKK